MSIDTLLTAVERAAERMAAADAACAQLAIDKVEHEAAVANALMGNTNPLTNKPHSATSAREAADQDERTMQYRRDRIALESEVTRARAQYEVARIRAWSVAREVPV